MNNIYRAVFAPTIERMTDERDVDSERHLKRLQKVFGVSKKIQELAVSTTKGVATTLELIIEAETLMRAEAARGKRIESIAPQYWAQNAPHCGFIGGTKGVRKRRLVKQNYILVSLALTRSLMLAPRNGAFCARNRCMSILSSTNILSTYLLKYWIFIEFQQIAVL